MIKGNLTTEGKEISTLYKTDSKSHIIAICDSCRAEKEISFYAYNKNISAETRDGRDKGKFLCRACSIRTSPYYEVRKTFVPKNKGTKKRDEDIKRKSYVSSDGYIMVFDPNRRREAENLGKTSQWNGYVKQHILVAERILGRRLIEGEIVHHLDGDKQNNSEENLIVLSNESRHRDIHNNLHDLAMHLVRVGLIDFNREDMTYVAQGKLRELLEQPMGQSAGKEE